MAGRLLVALLVVAVLALCWGLVSPDATGSAGGLLRGESVDDASADVAPLVGYASRSDADADVSADVARADGVARAIRVHVLGGHVVDDAGDPVADARVLVSTAETELELLTDELGRFETTLDSGEHVAWSVHKTGHALARSSRRLPRDDWAVRIDRYVKARLTVVDADGRPAEGAYAVLVAADGRETSAGEVASFHFRHGPVRVPAAGTVTTLLPAGRWYALTSWSRDDLVDLHRAVDVELAGGGANILELVPGRESEFTLQAPPTASLGGWVAAFDAPLASARIALQLARSVGAPPGADERSEVSARTDAGGRFLVRDLAPGDWILTVAARPGGAPCWTQDVVVRPRVTTEVAVTLPEQGLLVTVLDRRDDGPWEPATSGEVHHGPARELTGFRRVLDGGSSDLPGFGFVIHPDVDQAALGADGRVWLCDAEPGPVRVEARSPGGFRQAQADAVVVEGRLTQVELRLEPTLSVRLTAEDCPAGVSLVAQFRDEATGELLHEEPVPRDRAGEVRPFLMRVPHGSHTVTLVDDRGRERGRAELRPFDDLSWHEVEELLLKVR